MNTRQLKIFLAVCDHKNMTRAAKALYFTEPTVSQAIADLEEYYGVRLFERLNRRLYLTTAGERLQSYARHVLNLGEQVKKELSEHKEAGTLRVGASLTIGTYLLPGLLSKFHAKMPQVEIFSAIDNTDVIQNLILEDRIDIALVESPVNSPDVVEKNIRDDELVVICSPQHPLSKKTKVHKSDLAGLSFIIREPGSGTRSIFENAMSEAGISWKRGGVYNSTEAIKHAVIANLGLAVVSRFSIADEMKAGTIVALPVEGLRLTRKFKFIYHRQKFFTKAMKALMESCEEC
jgi:DNA-binding transcriptional LysR family regulator